LLSSGGLTPDDPPTPGAPGPPGSVGACAFTQGLYLWFIDCIQGRGREAKPRPFWRRLGGGIKIDTLFQF